MYVAVFLMKGDTHDRRLIDGIHLAILQVQPNSPAERAGLKAYQDYVIGADSVLHESEDFFSLVEAHQNKPLKLYVYNLDTDRCRDITITPNPAWGGEGRFVVIDNLLFSKR